MKKDVRVALTLVLTLLVASPAAMAARYTVFVANFAAGGVVDYDLRFGDFRNGGTIGPVAAINFECVSEPWPTEVLVGWTDLSGKRSEKRFKVAALTDPKATESRILHVGFSPEEQPYVEGMNVADGGVHRCQDSPLPRKDKRGS